MASNAEKCRKTKVVRVYGSGGKWVDVEAIYHASFKGVQWEGPDSGNLHQETIFIFDEETAGGQGEDTVNVDFDLIGGGGVGIPTRNSVLFSTRKSMVRLYFVNVNEKDKCKAPRKVKKRRIGFNHISDKFMSGGQPPSKPKEYMEAVKKSKDSAPIWLDIEIPDEFSFVRNKELRNQKIAFKDTWGGKVNLGGSGGETNKNATHLRLDPFQCAVNFGPDTLAAEFFEGDGPTQTPLPKSR